MKLYNIGYTIENITVNLLVLANSSVKIEWVITLHIGKYQENEQQAVFVYQENFISITELINHFNQYLNNPDANIYTIKGPAISLEGPLDMSSIRIKPNNVFNITVLENDYEIVYSLNIIRNIMNLITNHCPNVSGSFNYGSIFAY